MSFVFEHCAAAVCAISGVLAAAGKRIDLFGVMVLALVTALGGGALRDLMLGVELVWMAAPSFLHTAAVAAVVTFLAARRVRFPTTLLIVADAMGLALFTVLGTRKAMALGSAPEVAMALGVVTGVAGGILRDVLLREIPLVFRRETHLYATAAFAGAAVYALVPRAGWHNEPVVYLGAIGLILALRLAAMRWQIALPDFISHDHARK